LHSQTLLLIKILRNPSEYLGIPPDMEIEAILKVDHNPRARNTKELIRNPKGRTEHPDEAINNKILVV
jgi:hypothetical protein